MIDITIIAETSENGEPILWSVRGHLTHDEVLKFITEYYDGDGDIETDGRTITSGWGADFSFAHNQV